MDVDDGSGGTETLTTWFVYDMMGNVITECEQTDTGSIGWTREYVYSDGSRAVYMRRPHVLGPIADWNGYVSFISSGIEDFAAAWLCDSSCEPAVLTAWDLNDDGYIDLTDFGMEVASFSGAWQSESRLLATDYRGSVIGIVTADQTAIEPIHYDAWGNSVINTGTDLDGLSILWNGYYHDYETGNYYLKNRYYSPVERRFITDDPHGVNPDGNWNNQFNILKQYVDGFGLDVYANHDPVNGFDPWGLLDGNEYLKCTDKCDEKLKSYPLKTAIDACHTCCMLFAFNSKVATSEEAGAFCVQSSMQCHKPFKKTRWKWWYKLIGWLTGK
ncbi:Cell wall-associated polypeptide CWBP200 [Limihaloglobus sulfuriphilus]|uniref:Cell wall-associated polypeptide CWBP200 n=1 Tax=Limihaloglobus sulfuriphilus TaxID=1851148 RepID=A0A1Q2MFG6_9BACT|nr:RHS repeat-associated core domain-containing protein [Limihaloglobus sulfuriphilus]AQQ71441.1 Cell wall-associated polypeptide CWBP200 [Limihaloglobus sulfuriphilus]